MAVRDYKRKARKRFAIFILQILDFFDIFFAKKDRTIEYIKIVIKYFYIELTLYQLENENQSNLVSQRSWVRSPPRDLSFELLLRQKFRQSFLDSP